MQKYLLASKQSAKQDTIAKRYQQDDFATMAASGSWFKIVKGFLYTFWPSKKYEVQK